MKEEAYMKKIVVISSSPRKNGNSEILADQFIKGATSVGHKVIKIIIELLHA